MRSIVVYGFVLLILLLACPIVQAEEGDWEFDLTPMYLWAVNIDGTMGVMGEELPVSVSFGDALDKLNAAFTIHFEAR